MGFLNLMIFHSVQKGYLRVKSVDYQIIPVDSSEEFLNRTHFIINGQFL